MADAAELSRTFDALGGIVLLGPRVCFPVADTPENLLDKRETAAVTCAWAKPLYIRGPPPAWRLRHLVRCDLAAASRGARLLSNGLPLICSEPNIRRRARC